MKAAIYDPQFLSAIGIKTALEQADQACVPYVLDTSQSLLAQLLDCSPDLLVFEYLSQSPIQNEVLSQIRKKLPQLKLLIISDDQDRVEIKKYIANGIHGYLTKQCSKAEIEMAVITIMKGGKFYCPQIIEILTSQDELSTDVLSERETQVLGLIGQGKTSTDIANRLNLSIHTINSHRKNMLKKLGFKSPAELIAYAVKLN